MTFTYSLVPVLSALTPSFGPVGAAVTITGDGFTNATEVLFGEVKAVFTVVSDTQLRASAPVQPVVFGSAARDSQGFAFSVPVVVFGPDGASDELSFTYTGANTASPNFCDALLSLCGSGKPDQPQTTPPAPLASDDGGPALAPARMPNLRATVSGHWHDGAIRVTVRVLISKPRLVNRSFLVRVRIPALRQTKLVRVAARAKRVRTLHLRISGPASAIGELVIVRVDPTDRVLETRTKDNTASARIT